MDALSGIASQSEGLHRFEELFESLGVGVVLEESGGRMIAANPVALDLLDVTREQMFREAPVEPGWAVLHEDGWPLPRESFPSQVAFRTGRPAVGVVLGIKRRDGALAWLSVNSHPLYENGERTPYAVISSFRDVTGTRASERFERRRSDRFRSLIEYSADVITILDDRGRLIYESPAVERMLGYARGQIVGDAQRIALIHPDDRSLARTAIRGLHGQPGASASFEYRIRASDGSWRILESVAINRLHDPAVLGIALNTRDITERRETEAALRAMTSRLANLVQNLQAGVLVEDERRRIAVANAELCRIFGIDAPPESLLGADSVELAARAAPLMADAKGFADRIDELIAARQPERGEEIAFADGRTFERDYIPVSADRDDRGHLWLYRDISTRKDGEREAARARDEAILASRLKSEFLATMSHEIRTPMNGVLGTIELLLDTPLDPGQRDLAAVVRDSAHGLMAIIDDVLDLSKMEAEKLAPKDVEFDLASLTEGVGDVVLGSARRKGLIVSTYIDPRIARRVRGDSQWLRQVLVNLAGNAVKFTDRGDVRIRADMQLQTARSVTICFSVADTGIGIPEPALARLFEPFSQVDSSSTRRHGGTGLGLAISQRLVGLMGGELTVRSKPNEGTEMSFALTLTAAGPPGPRTGPRGQRVLIAEACDIAATIETDYLTAWGLRPERVNTAAEARRRAESAAAAGQPFAAAIVATGLEQSPLDLARALRSAPGGDGLRLVLVRELGGRWVGKAVDEVFAGDLTRPIQQERLFEAVIGGADAAAGAEPAQVTPAGDDERPAGGGHVLVAEDNDVNRELLVRQLARLGVRSDQVSTGAEAVDAVARRAYDAVLMDIHMPDVDGVQAAREIRSLPGRARSTPIVAITASGAVHDREACIAAGMDAFLVKPMSLAGLEEALARCGNTLATRSERDSVHLDRAAVERLGDELGDRAELVRIAGIYLEQLPDGVAAIAAAVETGDTPALRRAAHRLGASSATFGAAALAALCGRLERLGERGVTEGTEQLVRSVTRERELVAAELTRLLSGQRSGSTSSR